MGSILSNELKIYIHGWTPTALPNGVHLLSSLESPPSQPHKIILPLSQIHNHRKFIADNHHKIILLADEPHLYQLNHSQFEGIPVISLEILAEKSQQCRSLLFRERQCPIPLVLQRFNDSYVRNYIAAFHFYGLKVHRYDNMEAYMSGGCRHPFLVCSSFELQHLSTRLQGEEESGKDRKLTVLCFCNRQSYSMSRKVQKSLSESKVEVVFFHNMLEIMQRVNLEHLVISRTPVQKIEKILFFMNEKEKQVEYLVKMARKLQKSIRNVRVSKVLSRVGLIEKVQRAQYSLVILSNDTKETKSYLQLYEGLEKEGLEDRVIFLKRDNQITQRLIHKLQSITLKSKFVRCSPLAKPMIYFGTLDSFKQTLRLFPRLNFKLFIDSNKQRERIRSFLPVRNQVIVSGIRLCNCMLDYQGIIECEVILVRPRNASIRFDRPDTRCSLERWFGDQQQLLQYLQNLPDGHELHQLNYKYYNRKASCISKVINEVFLKLKEKKCLINNDRSGSIFLFSCEYYVLDQISNLLIRYFSLKLLGNYQQESLLPKIRYELYVQLLNMTKIRAIEEQVLISIHSEQICNVYELAKIMIEKLMKYPLFLQEVNNLWRLFLHQDRAQFLFNSPVLLFLLFLGFNKTSLYQYTQETIQAKYLVVKGDYSIFQQGSMEKFTQKARTSYLYTADFTLCEQIDINTATPQNQIIIKLEGSELTNFNLFLPLWRREGFFIIPPLTKIEVVKNEGQGTLKLSMNAQQKFLQRFSQTFLEQNGGQIKLWDQEKQMRKFDVFLDSMANSKLQTASYLLKKINREQKMVNKDIVHAYNVIYHIKKGQYEQAEAKIKKDRYESFLCNLISSYQSGVTGFQTNKVFGQAVFSSSKGIQQSSKQYHMLDDLSNSSMDCPQIMSTDPEIIRKYSESRSVKNYSKARSPGSMKKDGEKDPFVPKSRPIQRHSPLNPPHTSLTDAGSDIGNKELELRIAIFPPSITRTISAMDQTQKNNYLGTTTFGNKFFVDRLNDRVDTVNELESPRSRQSNKYLVPPELDLFQFEEFEQIRQNEGRLEVPRLIQKSSCPPKSKFSEMQMEKNVQDSLGETDGSVMQTGKFVFKPIERQEQYQTLQQAEIIEQLQQVSVYMDEAIQQVAESQNSIEFTKGQETDIFTKSDFNLLRISLQKNKSNMFTITRKVQQPQAAPLVQPIAANIEEEKENRSDLSYSQSYGTPKLKSNSSFGMMKSKENLERMGKKKLFTFARNEGARHSANLSPLKGLISRQGGSNKLFFAFDENVSPLVEMQSSHSISSIDLQEAEQVFPQEMIQTSKNGGS